MGLGSSVSTKGRGLPWGGLHNRATLLPCTCPCAAGLERRAQHIAHYTGEGGTPESSGLNIPFTFAPTNPQRSQENQCHLQTPGHMVLPPLESSRGHSVSCWQNTATQRPKAQRGSNVIPSWTLRIQPRMLLVLLFCPKHVV